MPAVAPGHFFTTQPLGFTPIWHCWCGAKIELDYSIPGMKSRLYDFYDGHEECLPSDVKMIEKEVEPA